MICKGCNEDKAPTEFRKGRSKCKACERAKDAARYERNKSRPAAEKSHKCCSRCKETKAIDNFYRTQRSDDGWDNYCKECRKFLRLAHRNAQKERSYTKQWSAANVEHRVNYKKEYRSRPEIIEREKAWREEYRARPEVLAADRMKAHRRRSWYKDGNIPDNAWPAILEFYGNKCLQCGTSDDLQLDHVIPLARGGRHDYDNVQVLCGTHNLAKMTSQTDYRAGKIMLPGLDKGPGGCYHGRDSSD